MRRLGLAAALAFVVLPASAWAAPPTITSLTQKDGRITVKWQLAGDEYKNDLVELADDPATARDGAFLNRNIFDVVVPTAAQRSATFIKVDDPGTYYVHVGSVTKRCSDDPDDNSCVDPEWSATKKIVVPKPPPPRRYTGRTSQGRRMSFTFDVAENRIRNFSIGYRARCAFGRQTGRFGFGRPGLRLRRDRTFSDRVRLFGDDGSRSSVRVRGRLRGKRRATGTFRIIATNTPAGRCDSGAISWRANT
jgi:hypothetical protein